MLLSSLKKKFAARLAKVQSALYTDVTSEGWFRGRPDKVRGRWQVGRLRARHRRRLADLPPQPPPALGAGRHRRDAGRASLLFVLARRMPARTAKGSAMLAQARGFREYIRTAEAEQLRFEEGADIFSRYLPFAVVFGEAERWVKVFGPLARGRRRVRQLDQPGTPARTAGIRRTSPTRWTASPRRRPSTIAASTPSSSGGSGFSGGGSSGGGGGGGGGGSW